MKQRWSTHRSCSHVKIFNVIKVFFSSQVMKLRLPPSSAASVRSELSGWMISWLLSLGFLTGELILQLLHVQQNYNYITIHYSALYWLSEFTVTFIYCTLCSKCNASHFVQLCTISATRYGHCSLWLFMKFLIINWLVCCWIHCYSESDHLVILCKHWVGFFHNDIE